jgi:hypothetical protein
VWSIADTPAPQRWSDAAPRTAIAFSISTQIRKKHSVASSAIRMLQIRSPPGTAEWLVLF